MLFIGQQAALIEVQSNGKDYLIGEETYLTLPTWVLDKTLTSANWNRALRYLVEERQGFKPLGFFLVRFDLYLQANKIVCLTKKSFEQKILNQEKFQAQFLQEIFAFRNRNFQAFRPKSLPNLNLDWEIISELKIDFNRCWVSDNFSLKNQRFKILFRSEREFKIEHPQQGQIVYYLNFALPNYDVIDFKTGLFYVEGRYQLNVEACLKFIHEDQKQRDRLLTQIKNLIQHSPIIPTHHQNWHLFNVTNDEQYLIKELKSIFTTRNFNPGLKYLEILFKELKYNYSALIFANPQIQKLMFQFTQTQTEEEQLKALINRYGVLSLDNAKNSKK